VLLLEGIHKRFMNQPVLAGLDLKVEASECIALLGRSGSGKSTLLKIVSGLELPDQGRVSFADVDLTRLSERERTAHRRRQIGQVFQSFELFEGLSVWENLVLPLKLNHLAIDADALNGMLARVGLNALKDRFPDSLSGGEQQRLGVLRALVHRPVLLLADEPTGNLDEHSAKLTLDLLFELARECGATLVVVTHAAEVLNYTDRAYELKAGALKCLQP